MPRILLVEDDKADAEAVERLLKQSLQPLAGPCEVVTVGRLDKALELGTTEPFDLVITDLSLTKRGPSEPPSKEGHQLIEHLHKLKPDLPVILITGRGDPEDAIEATKLGAFDYVRKGFQPPELLEVIDQAIRATRPVAEPAPLGGGAPAKDSMIGSSRAMQKVYTAIGRVADTTITVLIRGETGTGKELVARSIYRHSGRVGKPFITVNCAAIPETLLENELFGHEKGAFTDGRERHIGVFEQANGGTLFLDEIGDLSLHTQAKLLRAIQYKTIQRLGGTETIELDVRIIAATHHDLEHAVKEGRFREDLFYRLNVGVIHLPPLRERTEDIPALTSFFLRQRAAEFDLAPSSIQPNAVDLLRTQSWPGNVRELDHVICKSLLLSRGHPITETIIRDALGTLAVPEVASKTLASFISDHLDRAQMQQLENVEAAVMYNVERELYSAVMARTQGNQSEAARLLGVSRTTLRTKLQFYGLLPS